MSKIEIALVYSPQQGPPGLLYENDEGIIYSCATVNRDMHNVGMGFYSISEPTKDDCLLAIEPYCVLERDYDWTYVQNYKKIFTWTPRAFAQPKFQGKIVQINHPSCHDVPNPDTLMESWTNWNERANEIVFIANNKASAHSSELYNFRIKMADMLHQRSKYKVSWYGEIPINRPYYRGKAGFKQEILSKVKFSVCTENSYDPIYTHNYFTEKMPEVWFAGAVPIYIGCHNINDFLFAEHSYIDLRTYCNGTPQSFNIDSDSLISRIESFDEPRYENFKRDVIYNIKKENGLYDIISYPRMYDRIISTVKYP